MLPQPKISNLWDFCSFKLPKKGQFSHPNGKRKKAYDKISNRIICIEFSMILIISNSSISCQYIYFFKRYFFHFFLKILFIYFYRKGTGQREGEKYPCVVASHTPPAGTWPTTQACFLTGNQTGDPLVHRPALSPLSHTSQGSLPFYR